MLKRMDHGKRRRVRKKWRWIWFLTCSGSVRFFWPLLYPNRWSQRVLMGAKWKIWILSFHWYPMVYCRSSGLATTASQSQAIFQNVQKCWKWAYLASGEIPIFGHFFQMATILRPMEILTWNQLPVTIYFLNFYVVKSAFCYLTPF